MTGKAVCALTSGQGEGESSSPFPLQCFILCKTELLKYNTPIKGGSAWEPFANVSAVLPGCHRGSLVLKMSPSGTSARSGCAGNCSCFSQLLLAWRRGNESFLYFCAKAVSVLCNVFRNIFLQLPGNSPLRATFKHTNISASTGMLQTCT